VFVPLPDAFKRSRYPSSGIQAALHLIVTLVLTALFDATIFGMDGQ
jgi:hypothetical protein